MTTGVHSLCPVDGEVIRADERDDLLLQFGGKGGRVLWKGHVHLSLRADESERKRHIAVVLTDNAQQMIHDLGSRGLVVLEQDLQTEPLCSPL